MTTEERYRGIIGWFSENMPVAETELHYGSAYELLVATILSAQCTDKRVNMTTPTLFERFPTPQAMAEASAEEIFPYIKSISYPNNKAKNLAAMARKLVDDFGGVVPDSVEELQKLPGVGRKTANVVGSVVFHREVMGSGYACFPRIAQTRTDPECQDAFAGRTAAYGAYPFVAVAEGTPLADTPRPLCLYGPPSAVRYLRRAQMVPESGRSGGEGGSCSDGEGVNPPLVYSWSLGYLCGNVSTNHTI